VDGRSKAFDEWIEARPHSVMARIVSGKQCIKWAWQARGGGVSSTVSSADYELFFDRLSRAKAELKYAIELGDQFSEPYVGLITVAMGTGFERGELWRYYSKAIEHCEENYEAHRMMIHALTEKWGGDEGEMHVVATKVASLAKKGSALTGILADAHLEQWLYLQMCDEHAEAESYFKQESVCDEL